MSESGEVLKEQKHNAGGVSKGHEPNEWALNGPDWNSLNNKINEVILHHNPTYEINTPGSILIYMNE